MKKFFIFYLSFFLIISLLTSKLQAQLYSSGNNTISGNRVGVGVNNPSTTFQIRANNVNPSVGCTSSGTSCFNDPFRVTWRERVYVGGETPGWQIQENPAFFVNKNGRVGINTENPQNQLHVMGTISLENGARWQIYGTQNAFAVRNTTSGSYNLWINRSDGYMGINKVNPDERLHVDGNVLIENGDLIVSNPNGLGQGDNQIKLQSDGYIRAREIKVDLQTIPDYVFAEGYELMPLEELGEFVKNNKHLPGVKSEAEFKEEGSISLSEMNIKLLEKVEELTLYILQLEERIGKLEK